MHFKMWSAISFNLDKSKIFLSGNGLKHEICGKWVKAPDCVLRALKHEICGKGVKAPDCVLRGLKHEICGKGVVAPGCVVRELKLQIVC